MKRTFIIAVSLSCCLTMRRNFGIWLAEITAYAGVVNNFSSAEILLSS